LEIGHDKIDYAKMLEWWSKNSYGRNLYIGLGIYRSGSNAAWRNPNELPNQIKLLRQYPNVQGGIYFSSKSFNNNPNGWSDSLRNNYYRVHVETPKMDWLPPNPTHTNSTSSRKVDVYIKENKIVNARKPK
jgi:hypothetical protein